MESLFYTGLESRSKLLKDLGFKEERKEVTKKRGSKISNGANIVISV